MVFWIELDTYIIKKVALEGRAETGDGVTWGRVMRGGGYTIIGFYCMLRYSLVVLGEVLCQALHRDRLDQCNVLS
jgi:hypothetical protein